MRTWEILLLSFSVAVDASAVSAAGMTCAGKFSRRHCAFNAAVFFGGFQFIMPVAGFFAAGFLTDTIARFDHWAAFGLLFLVGAKMIWESWHEDHKDPENCPVDGFFAANNMWLPAIATSLDALAVGAGIAFAGTSGIWTPAAAMGIITGICSAASVYIGQRIVKKCGTRNMGTAGGIAIIAVGTKILLEHIC